MFPLILLDDSIEMQGIRVIYPNGKLARVLDTSFFSFLFFILKTLPGYISIIGGTWRMFPVNSVTAIFLSSDE